MAYIGKSPNFGVRSRYIYTASGSETSISGADDAGNTLSFSDGNYVDVYLNGILLKPTTDYNTDTANTIAGLAALTASDIVEIIVYDRFSVADMVSAESGGTFSGAVNFNGGAVFNEDSADLDFRVESNGSANMLVVDGGNDQVNIGGAAAITNGQRFNIDGTYSSGANGPNIMFFGTGTDAYPSMQILNYSHDDQSINFDSYYDGTWKSSDAGSNFSMYKRADKLAIGRATGVSAGSAVTWTEAFDMSAADGNVEFTSNRNSIGFYVINAHGSDPHCMYLQFSAAAPDDDTRYFLSALDSSATRLKIFANGDVQNHDNSYGALSDQRLKQNIVDSNSQWDDIKAVKVKNFKKKDDVAQYGDKAWSQIGVVAQELETVSPKLIRECSPDVGDVKIDASFGTLVDDTEKPDTYYEDGDDIPDGKKIGDAKTYKKKVGEVKSKVKFVNYSILYMKAVKALQEAMTRIETLETKVKTLEEA